jgi:hypothetical protein
MVHMSILWLLLASHIMLVSNMCFYDVYRDIICN